MEDAKVSVQKQPALTVCRFQACVAGIISAYHDGTAIIAKIKQRRAARKAAAPPVLLETTLTEAPTEIERAQRRGIERCGPTFERGDSVAVIALQAVTIELQSQLLTRLRNSYEDEMADFVPLVDIADDGRDRTIRCLIDLKQRLIVAASIVELHPTEQARRDSEALNKLQLARQSERVWEMPIRSSQESSAAASPASQPWSGTPSLLSQQGIASSAPLPTSKSKRSQEEQQNSSRRPSYFPQFRKKCTNSSQQSTSALPQRPAQPAVSPSSQAVTSPATAARSPQYQYQEWEDDPAQTWGAPRTPAEMPQDRRATIASSIASSSSPPASLAPVAPRRTQPSSACMPTPENDYLGFCKSAWRLQNGDRKGMRKQASYDSGGGALYYSHVQILACAGKNCVFASGNLNIDLIWDKMWTDKHRGLIFRWPFLAKSHVPQTKVKNHQYAFTCMFCVFSGQSSPVYLGTDTFLEHVATHRGEPISEVVAYRTRCIIDRVASKDDGFDINLWPDDAGAGGERRESASLSDDLLRFRRPSAHATDSMFSNEPWSTGLSVFHPDGDMYRTELE